MKYSHSSPPRLRHREVKKSLADYLEGELPLSDRALVDAHLDACDDCAREVSEMQQTIRLLRTMPEPDPPPMIAANVMRRIRAGETRPSLFARVARVLGAVLEPSFVLPASAVTVAALAVVVVQGQDGRDAFGLGGPAGQNEPDRAGSTASMAAIRQPASPDARFPASRSLGSPGPAGSEGIGSARTASSPERRFVARAAPPSSRTLNVADADPIRARRRVEVEHSTASPRSRYGDFSVVPRAAGSPAPMVVADRSAANGTARQAAQSRRLDGSRAPFTRLAPFAAAGKSSGGEDPRDAWLARAFADPVGFSRYISEQSLAEQEHWIDRLSDRADSRGLLDELVEALRGSGDETARWLADDFAAQRLDRMSEDGVDGPAASGG